VIARKEPGPGASINKMFWSEYHRRFGEIALDVLGMEATVLPSRGAEVDGDGDADADGDGSSGYVPGRWQQVFLSSRSGTIWGGTAQVQRNIVGERVLGLPKEPSKQ
jgi:alkylation response protein AidB-like acyl-CoA dehydrogenase